MRVRLIGNEFIYLLSPTDLENLNGRVLDKRVIFPESIGNGSVDARIKLDRNTLRTTFTQNDSCIEVVLSQLDHRLLLRGVQITTPYIRDENNDKKRARMSPAIEEPYSNNPKYSP